MPCKNKQTVNSFHSGYYRIGTLTNSEDPDEMLVKVAFHQGLRYLLK